MIVGLVGSDGPGSYSLSKPGEFIRCPWHGWEFDIRTGQSWCDPKSVQGPELPGQGRARLRPAQRAPTWPRRFPVTVEEDYLVIDL